MVVNIKTATFVVVIACSLPGAYCTSTYEQLISSVIRLEVFFFLQRVGAYQTRWHT